MSRAMTSDTVESFVHIPDGLSRGISQKSSTVHFENAHTTELFQESSDEAFGNVAFEEYNSYKSKIEKTVFAQTAGHSSIDFQINQMLLPTSVKRFSVPSVRVQTHCGKFGTFPTKAAKICEAPTSVSKMKSCRFLQSNRISKGSAILRATGSTWMTKAQKEKAFPNIDTSLMKLSPGFVEKEFRNITKIARATESKRDNESEIKVRCFEAGHSIKDEISSTTNLKNYHINLQDLTANNNNGDSAYDVIRQFLIAPRVFNRYRFACQNFRGQMIEFETVKLFRYLSKLQRCIYKITQQYGDKSRLEDPEFPVSLNINANRINGRGRLAEENKGNSNLFSRIEYQKDYERLKGHVEDTAVREDLEVNFDEEGFPRMTETGIEKAEVFHHDIMCVKKNENGSKINDCVDGNNVNEVPKENGDRDSTDSFIVHESTINLQNLLDPSPNVSKKCNYPRKEGKCFGDTITGGKITTTNIVEAMIFHDDTLYVIGQDEHNMIDKTQTHCRYRKRYTYVDGVIDRSSFFQLCNRTKENDADHAFGLGLYFKLSITNTDQDEIRVEVQHMNMTTNTLIAETPDFGGILGVFCRSGLHCWDREVYGDEV